MRALIVGATSWGCTLAIQCARAGAEPVVLCRTVEEAQTLAAARVHTRLLPGIPLPDAVRFVHDPGEAGMVQVVIFAVPSQRLRENVRSTMAALPRPVPPLVSASKGLEVPGGLRLSQVMAEEQARAGVQASLAVISGPNIAREIALAQPSTTVVASADQSLAAALRALLMSSTFRVYTNTDVVGVELGGALKNIVALGAGIGDALHVGENGRAAFLTRGLAEMARLGVALGANPLTFAGLACLGDLIATAHSKFSRNRYLGEQLGRGESLNAVLAEMVHVAEGVDTTRAARALARREGVEMPIVEAMHRVLFDGLQPSDAIHGLMTRDAQAELAGLP